MNTKQQEFDAVVAHLYKQGRPATSKAGCMYRLTLDADTTLSCAVGCRIPDSAYVPEMDKGTSNHGTGFNNLLGRFADRLPKEFKEYASMFEALQRVHDGFPENAPFNLTYLGDELAEVAFKHELNFTIPQAAA